MIFSLLPPPYLDMDVLDLLYEHVPQSAYVRIPLRI